MVQDLEAIAIGIERIEITNRSNPKIFCEFFAAEKENIFKK